MNILACNFKRPCQKSSESIVVLSHQSFYWQIDELSQRTTPPDRPNIYFFNYQGVPIDLQSSFCKFGFTVSNHIKVIEKIRHGKVVRYKKEKKVQVLIRILLHCHFPSIIISLISWGSRMNPINKILQNVRNTNEVTE